MRIFSGKRKTSIRIIEEKYREESLIIYKFSASSVPLIWAAGSHFLLIVWQVGGSIPRPPYRYFPQKNEGVIGGDKMATYPGRKPQAW